VRLREVDYQDERGRWYRTRLPDEATDADASRGILVGPLDVVDRLGLAEPIATRLHNQLHARGIWTAREAVLRSHEVIGALMGALRVDAAAIIAAFQDLADGDTLSD